MNKRSDIKGYLFKLGFVLFICIQQGQFFEFSLSDLRQLYSRNNIELVIFRSPEANSNTLNFLTYKQYISKVFDTSEKFIRQQLYCIEFLKLYNAAIEISIDLNNKIFRMVIAPILNKDLNNRTYHFLKIETLTYSA